MAPAGRAARAASGCQLRRRGIPNTVVFLIESSPANLDPRIGTDAQSEHIDELLFDGLVARDAQLSIHARRWPRAGSSPTR